MPPERLRGPQTTLRSYAWILPKAQVRRQEWSVRSGACRKRLSRRPDFVPFTEKSSTSTLVTASNQQLWTSSATSFPHLGSDLKRSLPKAPVPKTRFRAVYRKEQY